ncbi:MAG: helix-turn-helix domain-containing protein [Actinomycetota bacterium]
MVTRSWLKDLKPAAAQSYPEGARLRARADEVATLLGTGSAGWAVELGERMAHRITTVIPELSVGVVADEVRLGCEAVALGTLTALARDTEVTFAAMSEVLAGPAEVVARGIGVEHMLRSIHVAHAVAVEVLLDAAEQVLPPEQRFAEMRRINEVVLDIVGLLVDGMAGEYARAHETWLAGSTARRMELVEEILDGTPVPTERATRNLGYDLSRWHIAVVVSSRGVEPLEQAVLRSAAVEVLAAAGCTGTLVLPVGAHQLWAWGSRSQAPGDHFDLIAPDADVRVAAGLPAVGVDGFRLSHHQALRATRVAAMSVEEPRLCSYRDVDLVAMLSTDMPTAREFVLRELGGLAGRDAATATMRTTLTCYLDHDRSLAGTADELHVARNTVAYRVQRAEQLRGRPVADRRLQLHAALTLADRFGEAVLA